jgi:hypothetical protein
MLKRSLLHAIPATILLTALLSLLVCGQGTTPPQPSKPKATAKRKPATRKTTPPPQPAQSVQPAQPASPQAAPSQPAQPQPAQLETVPSQPALPPSQPQPTQLQPAPPQAQPPVTQVNVAPAPASPSGAVTSVSPKRPGVLRIGVVLPITQISPDSGLALSEAIRQLLISYLNGPIAEAIPLEARVPVQLEVEAKQKECDFVVSSSVGREQRSNSFAKLVKNATPVIGLIPGTGAATTVAGAASTAAATTTDKVLKAATDLSGNIKAKDEVSVTFKLTAPGQATPKLAHVLTGKAKTDGDQVLSTLLAEAANAVLQAATQK